MRFIRLGPESATADPGVIEPGLALVQIEMAGGPGAATMGFEVEVPVACSAGEAPGVVRQRVQAAIAAASADLARQIEQVPLVVERGLIALWQDPDLTG